ncbi:tRNA (cytidine32/uridine32-2'-O)-methyltransferase [Oceanospirillum multiglobuliferum]|uniref:tRNA (cytidine/uridine-2'-O-)-methyltransferase TrmJ n=1 Tax=Oceanospirillum multiglobuliferum TaxID=64969 RepID=A0A1T4M1T5_9GAMM|nr:tRNA (cytosine(32)/uridine(32)-2'-O)-methyltransferase TrmJ [Oceanospirillum multiglobuliferum]OPX56279.1 tRNA (cytosine(32)/uridine(32)-2'-O)-methyltransferase TrmJ [Oceanospirillum multiglobuliferum]SJZ60845.1 tRNA (cytidine32/uridine32-2'-O)-methyltransferase [Oceanospirillum multiglobuliferum]
MLQQIRIVLVNTTHPGNIGATARAMKNMGLAELVLVAPKHFPNEEANARSSRADDILERAIVVDTLEQALADCQLVVGTSARQRNMPWPLISPRQMAGQVFSDIAKANQAPDTQTPTMKAAVVFGREDRGLTNEELALCHYHVHIPTDEHFSSLNVAAAVQVLAYELRVAYLDSSQQVAPAWQEDWDNPWASGEDVERFYQHLEQTLIEIGFHDPNNPRLLMTRLRRLYQRTRLDQVEVNILRGILSTTQKAARGQKESN